MSAVASGRTPGAAPVGEALSAATDALAAAGVPEARLDAELLLVAVSGRGRASLVADPGAPLASAETRLYGEFVRRRLRREPLAYIVGTKGFRRIELAVDRRVLVPRPETELLVEVALEQRPGRLLDVGTGSGAIALAVADELPEAAVVATDTSAGALELARANAARLGLEGRVRFEQGTVPEGEGFDLVLANLPYVAARDWAGLEPEVTEWEPREALLAGPDGLDAYRALLAPECAPAALGCVRTSPEQLRQSANSLGGAQAIAVEIGQGQAPEVAELVRGAGFPTVEVREDLAGIERVVVGVR
ncbi:MAG TPA: peptide chain release factor N(5)-glutamine methyltransferase [Solirubrobacterales bacterium]|jgi:release factor glutamine methyltransferase|nr:peptide chain release factor N(5)-glutamine methyltransferase [Solirubrobacterales bacterium]